MLASCSLCGAGIEHGSILGPIKDSRTQQLHFVHRICAIWSPEVWETEDGVFKDILKSIRRGKRVKCSHCNAPGATLGCRVARCHCTFHYPCAEQAGATLYPISYLVACPHHRHLFLRQEFHEKVELDRRMRQTFGVALQSPPHPKKEHREGDAFPHRDTPQEILKRCHHQDSSEQTRKRKQSTMPTGMGRKKSQHPIEEGKSNPNNKSIHRCVGKKNTRHFPEEQFPGVENQALLDEDELRFLQKESWRVYRDTKLLAPVLLCGKQRKQSPQRRCRNKEYSHDDPKVFHGTEDEVDGWDARMLGGADTVMMQLREMVLLPLLYPEIFSGIHRGFVPARGILLHGPPGTGKTLSIRALAGLCAQHSPEPIALFARRGADCVGKYHGEAERTLRLLFDEAKRRSPSIIFLDELDALAPSRSGRSDLGMDQIYASIVSTLLSLMDGMVDRGRVIVIAATNRPDSIDPALRRPGRFDKEIFYPLPPASQRQDILKALTRSWNEESIPHESLLKRISASTEGFAGADLQALCAGAVTAALKETLLMGERKSLLDGLFQMGEEESESIREYEEMKCPDDLLDRHVRSSSRRRENVVQVKDTHWLEALRTAPPPCAKREGMAFLKTSLEPLPPYVWPLVQEMFQEVTSQLKKEEYSAMQSSWPGRLLSALAAQTPQELRRVLEREGCIMRCHADVHKRDPSDSNSIRDITLVKRGPRGTDGLEASVHPLEGRDTLVKKGPHVLLHGDGDGGQAAVASAVIRLFEGCPVLTLSLPALLIQGDSRDVAAGCVDLLRREMPPAVIPIILFLPRIETWALECVDEGVYVSEAWLVLQSMLRDAFSSHERNVFLLATCHFVAEDLPDSFLESFTSCIACSPRFLESKVPENSLISRDQRWDEAMESAARHVASEVSLSVLSMVHGQFMQSDVEKLQEKSMGHVTDNEGPPTSDKKQPRVRDRGVCGQEEEEALAVHGGFLLNQITEFSKGLGRALYANKRTGFEKSLAAALLDSSRRGKSRRQSLAEIESEVHRQLVKFVAVPTNSREDISYAYALQDTIEAKCQALRDILQLDEERNQKALSLALKRSTESSRCRKNGGYERIGTKKGAESTKGGTFFEACPDERLMCVESVHHKLDEEENPNKEERTSSTYLERKESKKEIECLMKDVLKDLQAEKFIRSLRGRLAVCMRGRPPSVCAIQEAVATTLHDALTVCKSVLMRNSNLQARVEELVAQLQQGCGVEEPMGFRSRS